MNNRRNFIGSAAIAGLSMPAFSANETTPVAPTSSKTLRIQSGFPANEFLNSFGSQWSDRVNQLSGGRLNIEFLPVGTVAKTTEIVQAVSQGKLDGGYTYSAYQHSMNPAFSLWCTGPGFGMDSNLLLAWHQYGGGKELLAQLYKEMAMDVVSIPFLPLPNQPFGWFKKEKVITRLEDLKGVRFRTAGLALDVMKELGMTPKFLPGSEIGPAIQRGEIDGGEFNNTTSDLNLGINKYAQICMVQSYAEATGCLELVFNAKMMAGLTSEQRTILETVSSAMSGEGARQMAERNSADYLKLTEAGTKFVKTPGTILQAQLNAWDRVINGYAAKSPIFAAIIQSQQKYAKRVSLWDSEVTVDYRVVYNHYFNRTSV